MQRTMWGVFFSKGSNTNLYQGKGSLRMFSHVGDPFEDTYTVIYIQSDAREHIHVHRYIPRLDNNINNKIPFYLCTSIYTLVWMRL